MDLPFTFTLPMPQVVPSKVDGHIERKLSALRGQFADEASYDRMLASEDSLIYEVYEIKRPEVEGELIMGVSIVHPGMVGREFFMTKGHFHTVLETAEIYYCLRGEGLSRPAEDLHLLDTRHAWHTKHPAGFSSLRGKRSLCGLRQGDYSYLNRHTPIRKKTTAKPSRVSMLGSTSTTPAPSSINFTYPSTA